MAWNVVATVTVGTAPRGVAYGNGYVYVSNMSSNNVSVIDAATNTVSATVTVGSSPMRVAYGNGYAYVTNNAAGTVSVIDATTNAVTATLTVGAGPFGVAYGNGYVYVANATGISISVIDTTTNAVTATITLSAAPTEIAYGNGYLYVTNASASGAVFVIDCATNTVSATVTVGSYPAGVAYGNGYVYVVNGDAGTVSVIDATTNAVTTTITIGGTNAWDASYGNGYVYVANTADNVATVIDAATNTVAATVTVGAPFGIDWGNNCVYVTADASNTVSVIQTASAPNAPSLTSPGNGSFLDATTNPSFTANNNSTDAANINARAMRLKASGATSYNYFNVSTGAFQSTIIWNAVNYAPGAAGTFGPISGLSNGITDNWSMADQEGLANLQGPFASDFTVNMQAAPNLSINSPVGSMTTSSSPSLSYSATPPSGAQVTGGQWLIYTLAATQVSGFTIDIATATIPAGAVSNVTFTGNPLTVAIQSGVSLNNSTTYVAYAAVTETGGEWSNTISSTFTISLDTPATPTITAVASTDPVTGCPLIALTVQGHDNLLSADDASFEGSIGTVVAVNNCAVAQSTAWAVDGSHSLSLTSTAAGAMSAQNSTTAYAVEPNTPYTITSAYHAAVTPESCRTDVQWLDSGGAVISTTLGTAVTDSTTGGTVSSIEATSPTNAATASLIYNVLSTAAASEVHEVDECGIAPGSLTVWTRGGLVGSTQAIITRSDGQQVRAASSTAPAAIPTPSQTLVVNDYEVTSGQSYTYTAQVQDILSSSATITSPTSAPSNSAEISISDWWLVPPLDTSLAVSPFVKAYTMTQTEQSAAHIQLGQSFATVVASAMGGKDGTITVQTTTPAQWTALEALINAQQICWMTNNLGDGLYVRIGPQPGGMSSGMGNTAKQSQVKPAGTNNPTRQITLTYIEMARP